MSRNLKLFKKITCILGITFLVLGMVPLPLVSKITTAAANVKEEGSVSPKALGLPNLHFNSNKKANGDDCASGPSCESGYCNLEGKCADQPAPPPPPPPTCGTGEHLEGTTCVADTPTCDDGEHFDGTVCVADATCNNRNDCADTEICNSSGTCDALDCGAESYVANHQCNTCTGNTHLDGNACVCNTGYEGNNCNQCAGGYESEGPGSQTCIPVTGGTPQCDGDVCPNIATCELEIPAGMTINSDGNCEPASHENQDKVVFCHVPPGNTENPRSLTTSTSSWLAGQCNPHGPGCHGGDYLGACVGVTAVCGDDVVDSGEECDGSVVGDYPPGTTCTGECSLDIPEPVCGNDYIEAGEQCDDGNNTNGDRCSATCVVEVCGDGVIQTGLGETCDNGNTVDNDGCNAQCITEYCGDKILQTGIGEACDDGNDINEDNCSTDCLIESCGDGVLQAAMGEQCDGEVLPVGAPQGAACSDICILEYCGDGITNLDEICDGEAWCTGTCNIKDLLTLGIDPYCATKAGVGNILVWEVINPNAITVPVKWTLDGVSGGPTNVSGGGILSVGNTGDGPASHTLSASIDLPGGPSASFSSSKICGTPPPPPPGGGGTGTGIIPVTGGAGGPNELLLIPVTGVDLGLNLAELQKLFMFMGLMLFGVTMMLEGFYQKRIK